MGILYIWNDKDLKSRDLEIRVRNELGVKQQLVNKDEIHDLEPNIKPSIMQGYYLTQDMLEIQKNFLK